MSQDDHTLETYVVEFTDDGRARYFPLASAYVKVREGDREVLRRAPEIANDDDPDSARQNAAAIGRRAGLAGVEPVVIDAPDGGFRHFFTQRGQTRAEQTRADGHDERGALAAASGAVVDAEEDLQQRDALLVEEEERDAGEATRLHDEAAALDNRRSELHPFERGLITPIQELIGASILALADVLLFGSFLERYAAVTPRLAWATAFFVGLGAAAAGWAAGRGIFALTTTPRDHRNALLSLAGAFVACAGWFLWGMEETRTSGDEVGELATIAFGAPLCALALVATAIISFVAVAGRTGHSIKTLATRRRERAAEFQGRADQAGAKRHELRQRLAAAKGESTASERRMPHVEKAAEQRALAEIAEGEARWGIARTFATIYPRPTEAQQVEPRSFVRRDHRDSRLARYLTGALTALGAGSAARRKLRRPPIAKHQSVGRRVDVQAGPGRHRRQRGKGPRANADRCQGRGHTDRRHARVPGWSTPGEPPAVSAGGCRDRTR